MVARTGEARTSAEELIIPAGDLDLEQTLESGQCFRWQRVGVGHYVGVVGRSVLSVRQELVEDPVVPEGPSGRWDERASRARASRRNVLRVRFLGGEIPPDAAGFLIRYFDCARDYTAIVRGLRRDAAFARVVPRRAGIHILRQDPFEVLISFIISANNHIPRIRKIIERLCLRYGEEIPTPCGVAHSFPRPEVLAEARLEDLRQQCGVGYRDRYVRAAARAIAAASDFAAWDGWPTPLLRRRLQELEGVGEKVADCVLLFGFHRLDVFPVDTWIARAMRALYFPNGRPRLSDIRACARERFGPYAGIAQQHLYAAFRSRRVLVEAALSWETSGDGKRRKF